GLQSSTHFETEIIVERSGSVLLNDETKRAASLLGSGLPSCRLRSAAEPSFGSIPRQTHLMPSQSRNFTVLSPGSILRLALASGFGRLTYTLFEDRCEVDHVRLGFSFLNGSRQLAAAALDLLLDQFHHHLFVLILVLLRLPIFRHARNKRLSHVHLTFSRICLGRQLQLGGPDQLIREVHQFHEQAFFMRFDSSQILPGLDYHPGNANLAGSPQRI